MRECTAAFLPELFEVHQKPTKTATSRTSPLSVGSVAGVDDPGEGDSDRSPVIDWSSCKVALMVVGLVEVVGALRPLTTFTSDRVVLPVVAVTPERPVVVAEPAEVDAILHVPLAELLHPECYHEERWTWGDEMRGAIVRGIDPTEELKVTPLAAQMAQIHLDLALVGLRRRRVGLRLLRCRMAHEVARAGPCLNEPAGFEQVVRLEDGRRADAMTAARLTNRLHPVTRSKLTAGDGLRHLVCKSFVALHTSAVGGRSDCI